ncbi:MAG: hypothetical protein IPH58_16675 [Sphingobacteriales bacterium]|nr:hypothetical protein [Sphingobacteriales bacterium]
MLENLGGRFRKQLLARCKIYFSQKTKRLDRNQTQRATLLFKDVPELETALPPNFSL